MLTSCSGCGYGNGCSSAEATTVKIAVVAPMPKEMVTPALAVKPRDFRNMRTPKRRSCQTSSNIDADFVFGLRLDTNSLGIFVIAHVRPELDRWPNEYSFDPAEDRRGCADAERQTNNCQNGKAR